MSESKTTRNHDEIKKWVEERGGHPATVTSTKGVKGAGVLRIDFPGYTGEETLEHISWDVFFEKFDSENVDFLYQERTADGSISRFSKFIRKDER